MATTSMALKTAAASTASVKASLISKLSLSNQEEPVDLGNLRCPKSGFMAPRFYLVGRLNTTRAIIFDAFRSAVRSMWRLSTQIATDSDEKCGGNESFVSTALDGNTSTLSTEPSLLNSPARVNFSMSVGGDKSQMIEESRNCKLGTSLGTYKLVSDALKYGGGRKEHRQNVRSKRLGCIYMENQVSQLVSYVTPQTGCTKLRHYIEGSKKSTQCVLLSV
ncbi:hypothetical protein ACLB2K_076849 [Fragaria x ananassa]